MALLKKHLRSVWDEYLRFKRVLIFFEGFQSIYVSSIFEKGHIFGSQAMKHLLKAVAGQMAGLDWTIGHASPSH